MNDSDSEARKQMHPARAKKYAGKLSSDLLDLVGLSGKVSRAGPGAMASDEGNGDYVVQHVWSISHLSPQELTGGFDHLRKELPKKGWRVTRFGHANSTAQQLQIEAVHQKDEYSLSVELLTRSTRENGPSSEPEEDRILFSVGSPTYRAPEGVDPDDYY
ncbi:hypothetical protein [Streptomyces cucumeris]|uniref:hypothetical protein n=1 Tax=Streptomyces cucumeris TaxID=2962890 RepID=UPI003D70B353